MARFLKQSTSVDVGIGPFLDSTDSVTPETALTLTQPDIRLKKNGGNWAQKNAAQTLSHEENGWYELTLDATDTNTLGILLVAVNESGALPVWCEFMVVPANVYDSLVAGSDLLDTEISTLATASALATVASYVDTEVSSIKAKTDNLPSDPADASDVAAAIAALLTTPMTEAYSTDGSTVTLAEALYELLAMQQEKSISGTTLTVKKRDGSTTAMTLTLNDASSPTGITRAS